VAPRLTDADVAALRLAVLGWFDGHARAIHFRGRTSPYGVLVAEVMAQQTQVSRVDPAWRAFMRRFPTVGWLSRASTADVVRAWSGLGYNRRAVQLHRAAGTIVTQHRGRVPSDVATLQTLPGVGPYTARAVAAVAFGVPVGAVDTNVRRVLERLVGRCRNRRPGAARDAAALQTLADRLVDPARPGDWTHALMDAGATLCRPTHTECGRCPLRPWCRSAEQATVGPSRLRGRGGDRAGPSRRLHRRVAGSAVGSSRSSPRRPQAHGSR
jgi:A/G-specific adenine glycosylase